jgi:hypothetical protein
MEQPTGKARRSRLLVGLTVAVAVLAVVSLALGFEIAKLNTRERQTRCDARRAIALAVAASERKITPDQLTKVLGQPCSRRHDVFEL